ncbi:hypothetical protein ACIGGF_03895 [Rhodococcus sp. NPDC078407]|uniref:hypothetical protein n=1 Tax=Rhodococcus sp. NPDC078407 TaxID=3364509 RepID=UPI0037C62C95
MSGTALYVTGIHESLAALLPMHAPESGTRAFRGLAASGKTYWIKVPFQDQGPRILATEQIVTALGHLIEAPVRDTALMDISDDWSGQLSGSGLTLRACVAHASLELNDAEERRDQTYLRDDDNARRWPKWAALWDWCFGSDEQWLYEHGDANRSMWSFDHNMWIHDARNWDADSCLRSHDVPWRWRGSWDQFDKSAILDTADRLEAVTRADLVGACYALPLEWGVPKPDIDALIDMLDYRRAGVSARLRLNSTS